MRVHKQPGQMASANVDRQTSIPHVQVKVVAGRVAPADCGAICAEKRLEDTVSCAVGFVQPSVGYAVQEAVAPGLVVAQSGALRDRALRE